MKTAIILLCLALSGHTVKAQNENARELVFSKESLASVEYLSQIVVHPPKDYILDSAAFIRRDGATMRSAYFKGDTLSAEARELLSTAPVGSKIYLDVMCHSGTAVKRRGVFAVALRVVE